MRTFEYMPGDAGVEGFRFSFGRKEVRELEWVQGRKTDERLRWHVLSDTKGMDGTLGAT